MAIELTGERGWRVAVQLGDGAAAVRLRITWPIGLIGQVLCFLSSTLCAMHFRIQ